MSRESENALLLLVGVGTAMITASGAFTRYVKASLMPWLYVSAAVLIVIALVAIVDDVRRPGGHHGHDHSGRATWLLVIPVVVLVFITPPALRPEAGVPSVSAVSTEALRRPFPPLSAGPAPEVSIPNVMIRAAQDSSGSLDGRTITVIGFTIHDGESVDLGRFSVLCCVADARLARIHLRGAGAGPARSYPEYTWLRVEGTVLPGRADGDSSAVPTMDAATITEIDAPADVYA